MSTAGDINLEIVIRDTFAKTFSFFEDEARTIVKDLTGYSFKAQIRKCKNSSTVILEFVSPTTIDITLASVGKIILKASSAVTGLLTEQNAVWDIHWVDPSSNTFTFLEGSVQILETTTKP